MTEGWLCEGNHPYFLVDGKKFCPVCELIKEVGAKPERCRAMGHTVPIGKDHCPLCWRYRKALWQKELDLNGEAECPNGHRMTHETLLYTLRSGTVHERKCPNCIRESSARGRATAMANAKARHEAGLTKPRPAPVRLPPEYCDWVVAYRLIMGQVDEVYDMKRGQHVGATPMEKWVAYHSTPEDYNHVRSNRTSGDRVLRYQWAEYGEQHGWEPKTLVQAIAET